MPTVFVAGRVASVSSAENLKLGNFDVSSVTVTFFWPKSSSTVTALFTAADKSAAPARPAAPAAWPAPPLQSPGLNPSASADWRNRPDNRGLQAHFH